MACPNLKNGPKNGLRPLGIKIYTNYKVGGTNKYLHVQQKGSLCTNMIPL
jgi:hypothetical protein